MGCFGEFIWWLFKALTLFFFLGLCAAHPAAFFVLLVYFLLFARADE